MWQKLFTNNDHEHRLLDLLAMSYRQDKCGGPSWQRCCCIVKSNFDKEWSLEWSTFFGFCSNRTRYESSAQRNNSDASVLIASVRTGPERRMTPLALCQKLLIQHVRNYSLPLPVTWVWAVVSGNPLTNLFIHALIHSFIHSVCLSFFMSFFHYLFNDAINSWNYTAWNDNVIGKNDNLEKIWKEAVAA